SVLSVEECWKGTCGDELTVRQLGGELDGEGAAVEGTAALAAGSEVVLFLRPRKDGAYSPVGMAQGAFQVERDAKLQVRAFVRDVRGLTFVRKDGALEAGTVERHSPVLLRDALRNTAEK